LPRYIVGSRQAEYKSRRVDGRGRYGKEYGNSLVRKRERRTNKEGRAASLRSL